MISADLRKSLLFTILVCIFPAGLFSQQANLSVSARTVKVGGRFTIQVEVPGNGARVTFGGSGYKVRGEIGRGRNITIINGRKTESINITYDAVATEEGEITVTATVKMGSRVLNTVPVTLNGSNLNDLFMKAVPEKTSVYPGQPVQVDYILYSLHRGITNYTSPVTGKSQGTFRLLPENRSPKYINITTYKGKRYYSVRLFRGIFVPVQSGTVPLPSLATRVMIDTDMDRDNFFGFSFFSGSTEEREVISGPQEITVKPFPEKDKPADFGGAVGSFGFDASIDRQELKTNDAITLRLTVSGYGSLNYIKPPEVKVPNAFRIYPPAIIDSIQAGVPGIFGVRTFEYIVLARSGGTYTIGPFRFSYFNPGTEKYETLISDSFSVTVEGRVIPDDSLDMFDQLDSALIRPLQAEWRPAREYYEDTYSRWWFWLFYLLPVVALVPLFMFRDRLTRLWPSQEERRRRKALAQALASCRHARLLPVYHEQCTALVNVLETYFAARFFTGTERVSYTAADHRFTGHSSPALAELLQLWQQAESERYSPMPEGGQLDWPRIMELLKSIDR